MLGVLAGAIAPTLLMSVMLIVSADRVMIPLLLVVVIAFPIAFVASFIAGLPLALWLRSKGWLSAVPLCGAGLLIGACVMAIFNYQMNYWPQMNDQSLARWIAWNSAKKGAASGAVVGCVASAAFCLGAGIAVRFRRVA